MFTLHLTNICDTVRQYIFVVCKQHMFMSHVSVTAEHAHELCGDGHSIYYSNDGMICSVHIELVAHTECSHLHSFIHALALIH